MKLEIEYKNQTRRLQITRGEENNSFQLRLESEKGIEETSVEVLGRSGDRWTLEINGQVHDVLATPQNDQTLIQWRHRLYPLKVRSLRDRFRSSSQSQEMAGTAELKAQMAGKVIEVLKSVNDEVESGEGLVIIESMKMQNELKSPKSGRVALCGVKKGGTVNAGDLLYRIE